MARKRNHYTTSAARAKGYRSGLEQKVADQIKEHGLKVEYESSDSKIKYTRPSTLHTYTPDFVLPNGIIVETKGRFTIEDRKKHLWIKDQHGDRYDIRFVFTSSRAKIRKGSKTTYADWCDKNGFQYADKLIPEEWFNED